MVSVEENPRVFDNSLLSSDVVGFSTWFRALFKFMVVESYYIDIYTGRQKFYEIEKCEKTCHFVVTFPISERFLLREFCNGE